MSERIGVDIVAKDGASKTFQEVSKAADKMGKDLEQAGTRASRAWSTFQANSKQIGASLGIVASGLALAGRSAFNHQRELDALNRMYGQSSRQIVSFSKEMENLTNVTDDQALVMANTMGTLVQNYGMSVEQIQTLIQRTIDLAALKGKSFEEASQMIQSAMRGEAEYAEQLGLTLNDRALGIDRLAKSTTDAEKAQIRYNAYLEQSAYALGYAEEQADGFYGTMYDLKGEIIDGAQALGEFMGPFGELGAFAADNAVQIAALTLAAGQLGSTLKALGVLSAAQSAGSGLLGVGGILGARGVAAGGILGGLGLVGYMLANPEGTGIGKDIPYFEAFQKEATALELTIGRLSDSGNTYAVETGRQAGQIVTDLTALSQRHHELLYLIENDTGATTQQTAAYWHELDVVQGKLGQQFADNSAYYLTGLASDINTITGYTGDGAALMQEQLAALSDQFQSGWLSPAEYASQVDILSNSIAYYDEQAQNGVTTTKELGESFGMVSGYAAAHAAGMERQAKLAEDIAAAHVDLQHQLELTRGAYTNVFEAMASGFRVAVSNTDAIKSQTDAIFEWADGLIAAEGVYSKLDDLVIAGRITGQSGQFEGASEYAAAQRAYNSIAEDRAQIEEHILTIQAKQAPLQAMQVAMTEQRLGQISELQGQEQMLALAYMDQATSMKALELAQGYVENPDLFGPMITQAAQYDQYLRELLVSLGLIEVDRDSNITLTGTEDAKSKLDVLTEAIEQLTVAQWVATFDGDPSKAEAAYERVMGDANAWDNLTASATFAIEDHATATLQNISALLNGLQDRTVTVTTINQTLNPFMMLGGVAGYAGGGVVIRAGEAGPERLDFPNGMHGLAVTDGLYNVPVGTYVNTAPATATGNHGGITVNVTVNGSVGVDDLTEQVTRQLVPALQRAIKINRTGHGQ